MYDMHKGAVTWALAYDSSTRNISMPEFFNPTNARWTLVFIKEPW